MDLNTKSARTRRKVPPLYAQQSDVEEQLWLNKSILSIVHVNHADKSFPRYFACKSQ